MSRPHPSPMMNFPISITLYQHLLGAAADGGNEKEYWEVGADALADWLRRHKPDAIAMAKTAGYQWKHVFLPNGTLLRTIFNGKNHHCTVEDDRLLYEGKVVSPSGFVNAVGGIRRNAWKSLWILLPDETTWKLADSLRPPRRPGRARARKPAMPAMPAQEAAAPAPCAHDAPRRCTDATTPESTHAVPTPGHAAPVPAAREEKRGIGLCPPHRQGEIAPAAAADPRHAIRPRLGERRARGTEPRLEQNAALGTLVREALLALSRSLIAPPH